MARGLYVPGFFCSIKAKDDIDVHRPTVLNLLQHELVQKESCHDLFFSFASEVDTLWSVSSSNDHCILRIMIRITKASMSQEI